MAGWEPLWTLVSAAAAAVVVGLLVLVGLVVGFRRLFTTTLFAWTELAGYLLFGLMLAGAAWWFFD